MNILTKEEILKIYKDIATGPFSLMVTHEHLDTLMEELIGEKDFTGNKQTLSNQKLQIMIGVIEALIEALGRENGK